ncbi:MAG: winged helix DNA-binding domain-containing protein [Gaiellaceae bacterium]
MPGEPGASSVLSRRALNRATLERQLLLRRSELSALDVVEHLVGMQAQVPLNPYTALWSRLQRFRPDELAQLLLDRKVVRIVVMRGTLHLVTAGDCLVLRPLAQPVLDRELTRHPQYGPALLGVELDPVLAFARALLAERPRTGAELRAAMEERFPEYDGAALAYACRNLLAFVQVPPRGVWGRTAQVASTTAESWLGRPLATNPSIDDVVLRYLAAFGPATVADVATWSRLTGLREVVDRLRPLLRTFRDERGRELVDLPNAPRPDPDTPAPPRFLPEFDNVLLSHADRSRFVSEEQRARLPATVGPVHGSVLNDGFLCGTWRLERDGDPGSATLVVSHLERLTKRATAALAAEGRRLLGFVAADADAHDVRFVAVD